MEHLGGSFWTLLLATQVLTKDKKEAIFYILIIATQTKQIYQKYMIFFNINENLKNIDEKTFCFNCL